jgi:GST-like protein
MFTLYEQPGWGSAIIEAQLAHYGLPCRLIAAGDVLGDQAARAALKPLNPLSQLPTLILPSGEVMTESAAITLHLADIAETDDLVPAPTAPERARFLRWLIFIVANIYPTFTYGDVPARFVTGEKAAKGFRSGLDAYAKGLWREVEKAAGEPWFLGARYSALDIYLAVMTRWRPREEWFAVEAPRLLRAATACAARPELAPVFARNFPG